MAIRVDQRTEHAMAVQQLLTDFGCNIKTRVGFHEARKDFCGEDGIIVLHLCADDEGAAAETLKTELNGLPGVKATYITI
jgi:hypothetical protein